jgi:hypothetical protein
MYTETELREALEHSASRADTLTDRVTSRRPKRHLLPALAAAAAVVTVVAGGVALQGRSTGNVSPPPARHTHAPVSTHVPVDLSNAIDEMQARTATGSYYYTMGGPTGPGVTGDAGVPTESIDKMLSGQRFLDVTLVDSSALDPGRIPRDHPVPIAGTTGYYSKFKLYPLDGTTGSGFDKSTPTWTIAFRDPAGKWVFVRILTDYKAHGVDDPAEIAEQYARLNIDFVNGQTRLPFRTGYVPSGYRLQNLFIGYGRATVSLTNGDETVDIGVIYNRQTSDCRAAAVLCRTTRRIGDYTITVEARHDQVTNGGGQKADFGLAAPVFDSLTIASKLGDPSTYWSIADALG